MKRFVLTLMALAMAVSFSAHAELELSGYFDFEVKMQSGEGSGTKAKQDYRQHHLNLMMGHEYKQFRFFTEIEYEDALEMEGSDGGPITGHGKLFVERGWGEWAFSKYATLRMGQILNSTLYQQNHYPSVVVNHAASRPQLVKKIFNGSYEGMKLYGALPFNLEYDLWTERANPHAGAPNENSGNSWGTRVGYKRYFAGMDFYLGYLRGSYHKGGEEEEKSYGVETAITYKNFTLWSEFGERTDDKDKSVNIRGYYFLASYEFATDFGDFTPYVLYDSYKKNSSHLDAKVRKAFGLNYKPEPIISLKAELMQTDDYTAVGDTTPTKSFDAISFAFVYFYN